MGKKPVDNLTGIRVELNQKERDFLEDLSLRQTFKTGGGILSDLGGGINSILTPFLNGGDAGLLGLWAASYVADSKLDDNVRNQLKDYLDSIQLYDDEAIGCYPNAFQVRGTAVCFCDPSDFPAIAKHWENTVQVWPWEIWPLDAYENTYLDDLIDWMRQNDESDDEDDGKQGPYNIQDVRRDFRTWSSSLKQRWFREFGADYGRDYAPNRGGPWRSMDELLEHAFRESNDVIPWLTLREEIPGLTYDDDPPMLQGIDLKRYWGPALFNKYGFYRLRDFIMEEIPATDSAPAFFDGNYHLVRLVWRDPATIDRFKIQWRSGLSRQGRMNLYDVSAGRRREQIEDLKGVLKAMSVTIPEMPSMEGFVDFITPDFLSGDDNMTLEQIQQIPGLGGDVLRAITNATEILREQEAIQAIAEDFPLLQCNWPTWKNPPKSIYKFETIHSIVEISKVLIPWYIGAKMTIAATGAVIPG